MKNNGMKGAIGSMKRSVLMILVVVLVSTVTAETPNGIVYKVRLANGGDQYYQNRSSGGSSARETNKVGYTICGKQQALCPSCGHRGCSVGRWNDKEWEGRTS